MKGLSKFILKLIGWKVNIKVEIPTSCVICVAPHTSNWDLPLGLLVYSSLGLKASFLMKKDWFFFPLNFIFKALGAIPVDRSKKNSLTSQVAEVFAEKKTFHLAVTPEGTRKANKDWKKGFYYIALEAHVPIMIASFDYKLKTITVEDNFIPTGDADKDMEVIKSYYKNITAKYPDKFLL